MNQRAAAPLVGVVMGSRSDWETLQHAVAKLDLFGIAHEVRVVSAHRTPALLVEYATGAADRGLRAIIAGAGGAAHLPGMLAAMTPVPVLGVPVQSKALNGLDSLLSIVQMPAGVPVATVSIGGARNAGLLAVRMLASGTDALARQLQTDLLDFARELNETATRKGASLRSKVADVFSEDNSAPRSGR